MSGAFRNVRGGYNRKNKIPGVSGRRIPGQARLPTQRNGGFLTNVPFLNADQGGSAAFREYHRQQIRDARGQFAGGWGFAWVGLAALDQAVYAWADSQEVNVKEAVEDLAREMESYMKSEFKWTRRSDTERESSGDGNLPHADEALQAVVVWHNDEEFSIYLGHGKDIYYGIWLEVRWGGRYAIIVPTAEHFAPQIAAKIGTRT